MKKIIFALGAICLSVFVTNAKAENDAARWECKGITVQQKGPSEITIGGFLSYDIALMNEGSCDLSDISVTDFIPRLSVFSNASPAPSSFPADAQGGTSNGGVHPVNSIQWTKLKLSPGTSVTFKVLAQVKSPDERTLLNTVCAESAQMGRICSEFETSVSP